MALLNTQHGYGALTKLIHWLVVALFAFQFAAANIMLRIDGDGTALGLTQATFYNWHKSIGLLALIVAVMPTAGAQTRPAARLGTHAQRGVSASSSIAPSRCSTRQCS